jgi:hypothetical protein
MRSDRFRATAPLRNQSGFDEGFGITSGGAMVPPPELADIAVPDRPRGAPP